MTLSNLIGTAGIALLPGAAEQEEKAYASYALHWFNTPIEDSLNEGLAKDVNHARNSLCLGLAITTIAGIGATVSSGRTAIGYRSATVVGAGLSASAAYSLYKTTSRLLSWRPCY